MAIPDFQTLMQPLLLALSDGNEQRTGEYIEGLAQQFDLTDDERRRLLPSGRESIFENRARWAATHLSKAGLLERPGRGKVRITERGLDAVRSGLTRIDLPYLSRFPEYEAFRRRSPVPESSAHGSDAGDGAGAPTRTAATLTVTPEGPDPLLISEQTPAELLESSYQGLRQALADDLLERIGAAPPAFFEQLVVDLLVAMGYGGSRADAGQAVGGSGDGGIDGIIKEDRLGLDFVYVQAKRWDQTIGRPLVQAFAGSLEGQRARKGVFITTSAFSKDAHDYVTRIEKRIVLVDGQYLAQLMIDHGVGVADVATYHVRRVDADYFGDE